MDLVILLILIIISVLIMALSLKIYVKASAGWCDSDADMSGKTVLITGANVGIGKETAKELAKRNARVVMACRSLERGLEAAKEIKSLTENQNVIVKMCDLSSLASIRRFAEDFILTESRLDVLICNAGFVAPPGRYLTEDFLEVQFCTNHLGHFLLTNLLVDLLKKSSPSRIVVVSSVLHNFGRIHFDNINYEKYTPDPFFTYCNSKLANILFVKELARRLNGTSVTVNALHPGLVKTEINRRTPWYIRKFIQPISYLWAKTTEEGCQTTVYLAVTPNLSETSGKYFSDCKEARHSKKCDNHQLATQLWRISELLTGLKESV